MIDDSAVNATGLVKSVSITNLLQRRDAALTRVNQAIELLREAKQLCMLGAGDFPRIEFNADHRGSTGNMLGKDTESEFRKAIDASQWQYLMAESGMRTFMDRQARQEWDEKIGRSDVPELTADNISATFASLHASRTELLERGVLNCFRKLSWDYKTNSPRMFGKKIILNYLATNYKNLGLGFNQGTCAEIDDLIRVFHVLEGRPEPDHRGGTWSRISDAQLAKQAHIEDEYLHLKWFLKGSGHLTFKKPEIVAQMNKILSKHNPNALPAF